MNLKNKSNGYVDAMGKDIFEKCPKTVLAAIAVSALTLGGDEIQHARKRILNEWKCLFNSNIITQKPPIIK